MKLRDIFSKLIVGSRSLTFALIIAFGTNVFTVQAQTIDGSLTGIVADEQGAALAGATVTITSVERNTVAATLQTNDDGAYTAISLIPGLYIIAVEKDGFSRSETRDVKIDIAQRARLDIALKIGAVSETVTVSAGSGEVQLERETSSLSEVITSEQIKELPLFSRNPTNLIALAGGVSSGTDANGGLNTSQLSINGSRTLNTEVTVDGVSAINGSVGDISFIPSVDALREFRVQTSAYSAEFGRSSGGTVSASVQSGGNKFSGSVYEYFRNEAFNANNYFNNSRGLAKPRDRYNQFGFSLGGPVYGLLFGESGGNPVGKIKNTFFFFNYEGLRRTIPRQFTSTVPTDAFRSGDFSSVATVIRDPLTGLQVRDASRATAANPLGLNIIPLARFDPAARAILGVLPAANLGGAANNYLTISPDKVSLNQFTTRIDHNIGTRARIYGRFSQQTGSDANFTPDASQILPGALNPGTSPNQPVDRQITVGSTQNFSSNIINEFIFGLNLNDQTIDPPGVINSPADLGFNQLPQTALVPGSGFVAPRIEFTGGFFGFRVGNTGRFGTNNNTLRRQNTA
ncbi:MAG: carboxypeptidase regulatory-like domain-containing protein, partial [Acidobacteriota bacterium]|nr:carboxypeptidase regulatory-like domain-containing protein [Acidobacteriota bacterium]